MAGPGFTLAALAPAVEASTSTATLAELRAEVRVLAVGIREQGEEIRRLRADVAMLAGRIGVVGGELTTAEAVAYLARLGRPVTRRTLARWVRGGQLSDLNHPRRYRADELALQARGKPTPGALARRRWPGHERVAHPSR